MVMLQLYEERYGIYNHSMRNMSEHPLSLVEFKEADDTIKFGPMRAAMFRYTSSKVFDYFHITFEELYKYPSWLIEEYYYVSEQKEIERIRLENINKNTIPPDKT